MRRLHSLVPAIALALAMTAPAHAAPDQPTPAASGTGARTALPTTQLPREVRPLHYDIAVTPDAQALRFDGTVAIDVEVLAPTSRITLNVLDIEIDSVALEGTGGRGFGVPATTLDGDAQTATFAWDRPLPVGRYTLRIAYRGAIATQANGLFASDYPTADGERRALFTQFEAPDARRFVPSWDEPAHKATFTLTATVPSSQMAVSNMPVESRTDLGDGRSTVRFGRTPKMSTYLLFFSLGDFERLTAMAGDTEVGVVARAGSVDQARFALDSSVDVLHAFNDYFGVDYPLPKLDNIAAPGRSQFFGAMENWGAILTFEHTLLLDPAIATAADRQRVYSVGAHEIAHQWFGNLVTMQWWDDLWLNEGFASWMAGRITEQLHPEWETSLNAVLARDTAMGLDAVASTHPVVQPVETVDQISQAFDAITYRKGQAVIRMLEGYVGEDAWRTGVQRYMAKHAYGNTVSQDLWREIQAAAGKPVLDIARDFTLQPGVPLVTVAAAQCEDDTTTLTLAQGEFTKDRPGKTPLAWRVPVIATVLGTATDARTVLAGQGTLAVPGCGVVVVNAGQTGYYRTRYAPELFAQVRDAFAKVEPMDQLGLLQDTWALGLAGLQPASDYLDLVAALPDGTDPKVWGEVASGFASLDAYYAGDPAGRARLRAFAIATLSPVLARVGWVPRVGEPDPSAILRTQLIDTLGVLGDAQVIAEARRRYAAETTDPAAMPASLRRTILGVVARNADAATWDRLHAAARAERTPLVRDMYYGLLAIAKDAALARRALELSLTAEPGETNSASMMSAVAYEHPDLAFDFAMAHRGQVDARVDASSRSRYYPALGSASLDAAMVDKIRDYAQTHLAEGARRPAETAIANIQYRRHVVAGRLPAIDAWLKQHGG